VRTRVQVHTCNFIPPRVSHNIMQLSEIRKNWKGSSRNALEWQVKTIAVGNTHGKNKNEKYKRTQSLLTGPCDVGRLYVLSFREREREREREKK